ncbi:MAG: 4-hydroxy-3-methylbut-2-enyl diphosphate reductase, partial [Planctomycetota bacterium]
RLELPADAKVAYLTQTTLSVDDAERIVRRLKTRFPHIVGPPRDDICYATQNRQEAVRRMAASADIVLVVGSRNSSNSRRLAEIAESMGVEARLIDGPEHLQPQWFRDDQTVGITAGASAPEHLVQGCVDWLRERFEASVESFALREENVRFPLPVELRSEFDATS